MGVRYNFFQKTWRTGELVLTIFRQQMSSKNKFGGSWTEAKMEIVISYVKAYLQILCKQTWAKTIYFDGFAGSGLIETRGEEIKKGTALRVLDVIEPCPFDLYYFVEMDEQNKKQLETRIQTDYFGRNAHIIQADCNTKLFRMADFLKSNSKYRALVFIDPYGMVVNWSSIQILKGLGVDLWILVPTGIGVARLLKNMGKYHRHG